MIKHLNANLPKNGKKKKNLRGHVNDGHFSRWPWIWSIYLWYSRQQWQQWLDMSWTFLLVRIDILTSLMPVIGHCASLQCFHWSIQYVYALQAPCHTSRISQSLNWENGILTICWAGFKFHWLRGEMLLLDCSSRAEDIGAFNLFQQVDLSEDLFFYMWFVSSNQDGVYIRPCLKITTLILKQGYLMTQSSVYILIFGAKLESS